MVLQSGAMPEEKSIRGSRRGFTSSVDSQFTRATASWLAQQREHAASRAAFHAGLPALAPADPRPSLTAGQRADAPSIECEGELWILLAIKRAATGPRTLHPSAG